MTLKIIAVNKQKILIAIAALIITIILLEIFLRLFGFIYIHHRLGSLNKRKAGDAVRLLCLGDSFTFGIGAPGGYSYPEQLQQLLDRRLPNKKFIVYNEGRPGQNSSMLFRELPGNIQKYTPDIIIVMTGCNNSSNFKNSNYFRFMPKSGRKYLYRYDSLASHSKVYRLLKAAAVNLYCNVKLRMKFHNSNSRVNNEDVKFVTGAKGRKCEDGDIEENLAEESEKHFKQGQLHENSLNIERGILEYKEAIKLNPCNDNYYYRLGFLYLHRCPYLGGDANLLAIEAFKQAIAVNDKSIDAHSNLYQAYYRAGMKDLALGELRMINTLDPKNDEYSYLLKYGLPSYGDLTVFREMLTFDLSSIVDFASSQGVRVILQNYPEDWPNDVLRDYAQRYKLEFIDNASVFRNLLRSDGFHRKEYFAEDGHCNARGYKIIAENIYNQLWKNIYSDGKT